MPRNVRNFWIELEVDGTKTKVATGPVAKDGGFLLKVSVRDAGRISLRSLIVCGNNNNGTLELDAHTWTGNTRDGVGIAITTLRD